MNHWSRSLLCASLAMVAGCARSSGTPPSSAPPTPPIKISATGAYIVTAFRRLQSATEAPGSTAALPFVLDLQDVLFVEESDVPDRFVFFERQESGNGPKVCLLASCLEASGVVLTGYANSTATSSGFFLVSGSLGSVAFSYRFNIDAVSVGGNASVAGMAELRYQDLAQPGSVEVREFHEFELTPTR